VLCKWRSTLAPFWLSHRPSAGPKLKSLAEISAFHVPVSRIAKTAGGEYRGVCYRRKPNRLTAASRMSIYGAYFRSLAVVQRL
jgi:hypothetical protein